MRVCVCVRVCVFVVRGHGLKVRFSGLGLWIRG